MAWARWGLLLGLTVAVLSVGPSLASIIIGLHDDPAHPDGRDSLLVVGPKAGMTQAQIDQIRESTGYVICENSTDIHIQASGSLVVTNQEIVTAKHFYEDALPHLGHPGLAHCFFQNQEDNYQKAEIDFSPGNFILGPGDDDRNDWIVAKLKQPIGHATPIPVATHTPIPDEELITVSTFGEGMVRTTPNTVPVAQICYARNIYPSQGDFPSVIQSDCDDSSGMSGGSILVWEGTDQDRHLASAEMMLGGPEPSDDGKTYGGQIYQYSVGFDANLLKAAYTLAGLPVPAELAAAAGGR